ncbi:MAG: hypothetical protein ACREML_11100 [Vulcanimicrobiaceae bacterium]
MIACFILVLLVSACGGKGRGNADPDATPTSDTYLGHHGEVMPLRRALAGVAFRPFLPAREIVETAVLPPYNGGDDTRINRGIGFEYISKREAFVLKQWPGSGLPGPHNVGTISGCQITAYDMNGGAAGKQGALWSNGRIASNLIPAGNASDRETFDEARRLVQRGACR